MKSKKYLVMIGALAAIGIVVLFGVVGVNLSRTIGDFAVESEKSEAETILANANFENESIVSVPVIFYDQKMDECVNEYDENSRGALKKRQFEWASCGYYYNEIENGLVDSELDEQYLPVAVGGNLVSNRGVEGANFVRWFSRVDGLTTSHVAEMKLKYDSDETSFNIDEQKFYPLDELAAKGETFIGDAINSDGHNHLFTMNLGIPIRVLANGEEEFTVTADDDTFVFVDKKLVLDMGGVHSATTGSFRITEDGEVYAGVSKEEPRYTGVNLERENGAVIRIFHADRNSSESVFKMKVKGMVLNLTEATLARAEAVVAYDPLNPGYVPPLGESSTVGPNLERIFAIAVSTQGMILGILAICIAVVISLVVRYLRRARNQEQ